MKRLAAIIPILTLLFLASSGKGDAIKFVQDHSGIALTNYQFGTPPSAFLGYKQKRSFELGYDWYEPRVKIQSDGFLSRTLTLGFKNNKLEAIQIFGFDQTKANEAIRDFAKLKGVAPKSLTGSGSFTYADGQHQLKLTAYCSAERPMAVEFVLTQLSKDK
jgi:hypothetical protein